MSKFEVSQSETFTITKKGDSSTYVSLNRAEAEDLLARLARKLDMAVSKLSNPNCLWKAGDRIPEHSPEPNLPEGSRIQDDSPYKDIAVRVGDGWEWETMLGSRQEVGDRPAWRWSSWEEQAWTVLSVGK